VLNRRDLLIGGACAIAAGSAQALKPRRNVTLLGDVKLGDVTPRRFANWAEVHVGQVIQPETDDSLAKTLYNQRVARVYEATNSSAMVMLLVAYGSTQSDVLQLHRPETCYPAFGFSLSSSAPTSIPLRNGIAVPARNLVASIENRMENVTYFTRIGEFLPRTQSEQRVDKLKTAFQGIIPDGILVRCSTLGGDTRACMEINRQFLADLVSSVAAPYRKVFIGSALARGVAS